MGKDVKPKVLTSAEIDAMLPPGWRDKSFIDGVRWIAGLAAAIAADDRVHDDTSQEAMVRLCMTLSQLAGYRDD